MRLARTQASANSIVIIDGNVNNLAWHLPELQEFAADKTMSTSRHQWCNYGVSDPASSRPSSAVTTVLSMCDIPSRDTCTCGRPKERHLGRHPAQSMNLMRTLFLGGLLQVVLGIRPELLNGDTKMTAMADDKDIKHVRFRLPDEENLRETQVSALLALPETPSFGLELEAPEPSTNAIEAFPTEQRVRAKELDAELKAKGLKRVAKKKPQVVEQHFDDCGSNLTPTMWVDELPGYLYGDTGCNYDYDVSASSQDYINALDNPQLDWSIGSTGSDVDVTCDPVTPEVYRGRAQHYVSMLAFMTDRQETQADRHDDIAEICGGAGYTTQLLVTTRIEEARTSTSSLASTSRTTSRSSGSGDT